MLSNFAFTRAASKAMVVFPITELFKHVAPWSARSAAAERRLDEQPIAGRRHPDVVRTAANQAGPSLLSIVTQVLASQPSAPSWETIYQSKKMLN